MNLDKVASSNPRDGVKVPRRRLWHFGMGMFGVVGAGMTGYLGILALLFMESDDGGEIIVLFGLATVFFFWLAWRTGRMLSASVNVEQLGREGSNGCHHTCVAGVLQRGPA